MAITVYPVPGRIVLRPDQGFTPVPAEGYTVSEYDPFYVRALADGDLKAAQVELPKAPVSKKSARGDVSLNDDI